jgi:hypothetical protein
MIPTMFSLLWSDSIFSCSSKFWPGFCHSVSVVYDEALMIVESPRFSSKIGVQLVCQDRRQSSSTNVHSLCLNARQDYPGE